MASFFLSVRPRSALLLLLTCSLPHVARAAEPPPPPPLLESLPLDSVRARLARPGMADTTRVRYLTRACGLLRTTDLPAARRYGTQGVALARRIGFDRGEAGALANLAAIEYYTSNYPAAQRTFEATLKVSQRAGLPIQVGHAWLGLGNVAQALNNVPRALGHFEQARAAYAAASPPYLNGQIMVLNNSANAYNLLKQPAKAGRAYRQALALAGPSIDPHLLVAVLDGLAGYQHIAGYLDSAQATMERGLALAQQTHDAQGEAGLRGQLAENALARNRPDLARPEAERALALARQVGDPFLEEDALSVLAGTLHALRRLDGYDTLRRYIVLHDTVLSHDRTDAIIEAQTRFDVAGQQARIQVLEQQRRIAGLEAERSALRTRWLMGWGVLLAVLAVGGVVVAYRRRQARLEASLRARLAADLHDDVGSLLTQLTIQSGLLSANQYPPDEQRARLDRLADISRRAALQLIDVVWSLDANNDSFDHMLERLREHAYDVLGSAEIGLDFTVGPDVAGTRLAPDVRQHVYLIFKEALHNIIKHAHAARVRVGLTTEGRALVLSVHDDGAGAAAVRSPYSSGRGLTSMQARAHAVGGTLAAGPDATGFGVRLQLPR